MGRSWRAFNFWNWSRNPLFQVHVGQETEITELVRHWLLDGGNSRQIAQQGRNFAVPILSVSAKLAKLANWLHVLGQVQLRRMVELGNHRPGELLEIFRESFHDEPILRSRLPPSQVRNLCINHCVVPAAVDQMAGVGQVRGLPGCGAKSFQQSRSVALHFCWMEPVWHLFQSIFVFCSFTVTAAVFRFHRC